MPIGHRSLLLLGGLFLLVGCGLSDEDKAELTDTINADAARLRSVAEGALAQANGHMNRAAQMQEQVAAAAAELTRIRQDIEGALATHSQRHEVTAQALAQSVAQLGSQIEALNQRLNTAEPAIAAMLAAYDNITMLTFRDGQDEEIRLRHIPAMTRLRVVTEAPIEVPAAVSSRGIDREITVPVDPQWIIGGHTVDLQQTARITLSLRIGAPRAYATPTAIQFVDGDGNLVTAPLKARALGPDGSLGWRPALMEGLREAPHRFEAFTEPAGLAFTVELTEPLRWHEDIRVR
ncbi:MAG: hypothetical protein EA401_00810 [Planctomycetota bacterium]|nr:MAG: hypothetical protein EA401_00810 [Planctomycetota bacterium]